jgi:hypothetical protein
LIYSLRNKEVRSFFVWFWNECNTGFIKWVRQFSFPFYFMEQFKKDWYYFFFKCLIEFIRESIRSSTFLLRRFFFAVSISLYVIDFSDD